MINVALIITIVAILICKDILREVTIISLVNYSVKSVAKSKWSHNIMKV